MLTLKQSKFLDSYLRHDGNVSAAAREVGITRATASRYVGLPEFQSELKAVNRRTLDEVSDFLREHLLDAAKGLVFVLKSKDTPAAVRVQTSQALFSIFDRLSEQSEILESLHEIESQLARQDNGAGLQVISA